RPVTGDDLDAIAFGRSTDRRDERAESIAAYDLAKGARVDVAYLDDGAELFVEQLREYIALRAQLDLEPAPAGERHLAQRREQAAVRSVVIGEQQSRSTQLDDRGAECAQRLR